MLGERCLIYLMAEGEARFMNILDWFDVTECADVRE